MTSIRKRLDNILCELEILQEALKKQSRYPPCCIKIYSDGKISCDIIQPLPKREFLNECKKCRAQILKIMAQINLTKPKPKQILR